MRELPTKRRLNNRKKATIMAYYWQKPINNNRDKIDKRVKNIVLRHRVLRREI